MINFNLSLFKSDPIKRCLRPIVYAFFQSFVDAAHALKERGAYKIYVLATHGILSADAPRLIEESPINEVTLTEHLNQNKIQTFVLR